MGGEKKKRKKKWLIEDIVENNSFINFIPLFITSHIFFIFFLNSPPCFWASYFVICFCLFLFCLVGLLKAPQKKKIR